MLAAVGQRFGTTQAGAPFEWLSDNGSACIDHRTRSFARELGLEPLTTLVRSPQSNGMAESFVRQIEFIKQLTHSEPPRIWWRLQLLRKWSHEQVEQVFC